MWDPPNPGIMSRINFTCNPLRFDGGRKVDPIYRGPTSSHSVTKQARLPHSGRADAVDFIVDRCSDRHAGTGFGLSRSIRHMMSANRSLGIATSAIWKVT